MNLDSPYLIPTLLGFTAEKSILMLSDNEAVCGEGGLDGSVEGVAVGLGGEAEMPMY